MHSEITIFDMVNELGICLKNNRKDLGLTLRFVQEQIGVSNAYLSQIENGKIKSPSPMTLFKLSNLYNVSYSKLFSLAGYPMPEVACPSMINQLSHAIESLTEEEVLEVFDFIDFLKYKKRRALF